MQYILTQEEYDNLRNKDVEIINKMKSTINDLCQEVASLRPISKNFNGVKKIPHMVVYEMQIYQVIGLVLGIVTHVLLELYVHLLIKNIVMKL